MLTAAILLILTASGCKKEQEAVPEAVGSMGQGQQEGSGKKPDSSGKNEAKEGAGSPNEGGSKEERAADPGPILETDAAITFEGDLRLKAPATTLVPPTKQAFRIRFKHPMDRESVVRAILASNAAMRGQENVGAAAGKFAFDWQSDTELRIELRLTAEDYIEEVHRIYAVQVNGAKTRQGAEIQDQAGYRVVVSKADQLWRITSDGKKGERLTSFEVPYGMRMLDAEGRFLLLTRPTLYCECDAQSTPLYSVYDMKAKSITDYPIPLFTQYVGDGAIIADRRGFMYADTSVPGVPDSKDTVRIRLDGYVQGAQFTKDGKAVVAAVGKDARQVSDLDLVLVDLATGKERRFAKALLGKMEENMVNDGTLPVSFYDDGKHIYTRMYDTQTREEIRYRYDSSAERVGTWSAPKAASSWSGFVASADGAYRMYANAGLYKGEEKKADIPRGMAGYPVYWLGASHTFVYKGYEEPAGNSKLHLYAYDADAGQRKVIVPNMPLNSELIGSSSDGKWIYVQSTHDMKPD
jgi:hypothetical protein